ncbi:hypothetical protein HPF38_1355 [Helicobacter pylori]|nr:hypothetical protein HPF28_1332 [Helicobacter pylori]BAW53855.1 hypothetical protein HPF38_1355 [Helicobacter pylori]BAW64411.1 hypothetical protein HPF75_0997 [Helicobacter pylori]BAW64754.1 hypothetical protein HPF75_1336 [Helicobacter pylori]
MAQLEDLKAHEKYNLLLCMVLGTYKGTIPGNEDFKELFSLTTKQSGSAQAF